LALQALALSLRLLGFLRVKPGAVDLPNNILENFLNVQLGLRGGLKKAAAAGLGKLLALDLP